MRSYIQITLFWIHLATICWCIAIYVFVLIHDLFGLLTLVYWTRMQIPLCHLQMIVNLRTSNFVCH